MLSRPDLVRRAFEAFSEDASSPPPLTLRGANAVDSYDRAEPYDAAIDEPTDAYIEGFAFWGLTYLDARSWRHYLPRLIEYGLRHADDPRMAVEALVRSCRPPDRYPPRLATLTAAQETIVRDFLELVAFGDIVAGLRDEAQQALEEWWLPNPRSRPTLDDIQAMRAQPVEYKHVGEGGYRLTVPQTLTGSGIKVIPTESRSVEVWGGHMCGDVHTVVAVNRTPLSVRSYDEEVRLRLGLFNTPGAAREVVVHGATRASQRDGESAGDSPAEPHYFSLLVAEAEHEVVTLTVRSWPREDAIREMNRIVGSFSVTPRQAPS